MSADFDYSEIGAEQMLKGVGKIVKCSDDDSHYEEHHKSTFPDTLHHTVPAAGSDILADESGDGNTERSHNHPEDCVNFAVGGVSRHSIGAESVDYRHKDEVGEGKCDF